jgi:hypothetical protein
MFMNINHYAADTIHLILHIRTNFPILFKSIMAVYSAAVLLSSNSLDIYIRQIKQAQSALPAQHT